MGGGIYRQGLFLSWCDNGSKNIALTMYNYRRSLSEFPMLVTAGRLLGDGWITFAKGKKQQIDGDQL